MFSRTGNGDSFVSDGGCTQDTKPARNTSDFSRAADDELSHPVCVLYSVKLDGPWCSRNQKQCTKRDRCLDKRGAVLGSLWDDDNEMILGQVADDRFKKGMVKISLVVDSGAEAASREHCAVDPGEAECSLESQVTSSEAQEETPSAQEARGR